MNQKTKEELQNLLLFMAVVLIGTWIVSLNIIGLVKVIDWVFGQ